MLNSESLAESCGYLKIVVFVRAFLVQVIFIGEELALGSMIDPMIKINMPFLFLYASLKKHKNVGSFL
jgi:hypothetical protein